MDQTHTFTSLSKKDTAKNHQIRKTLQQHNQQPNQLYTQIQQLHIQTQTLQAHEQTLKAIANMLKTQLQNNQTNLQAQLNYKKKTTQRIAQLEATITKQQKALKCKDKKIAELKKQIQYLQNFYHKQTDQQDNEEDQKEQAYKATQKNTSANNQQLPQSTQDLFQKKIADGTFSRKQVDNLPLAKWLVNTCQLKPTTQDSSSWSRNAIHWTCYNGHLEIVKWLVNKNNLEAADNEGLTPLHIACQRGKFQIARWLVNIVGAKLKATDNHGFTPLHWACYSGELDIVRWLVNSKRVDTKTQDKQGRNAFYYAQNSSQKHTDLINWLKITMKA